MTRTTNSEQVRWSYRRYGDENYHVLDHFGNVVATGIKTDTTAQAISIATPSYASLIAALEAVSIALGGQLKDFRAEPWAVQVDEALDRVESSTATGKGD